MEEVWHSSGHLLSLFLPYQYLILSNLIGHPLHPTMTSSTGIRPGVTAKFIPFFRTASSLGLSSLLERLATQWLSGGVFLFSKWSNFSFCAALLFIAVISWALEVWAFKSSISTGFRTLARWFNSEDIILLTPLMTAWHLPIKAARNWYPSYQECCEPEVWPLGKVLCHIYNIDGWMSNAPYALQFAYPIWHTS